MMHRPAIAAALPVLALTLALAACDKKAEPAAPAAGSAAVAPTVTAPPKGGTWVDVVNETGNGFVMGNPNAKVKVIEIASLGCPFCQRFATEGAKPLEEMVKGGQVSWEFRPYIIHGPVDVAANILARCLGTANFFKTAEAMYADQPVWMGRIEKAPRAELEAMQNLPPAQAFVEAARLAGLDTWAAQRGLPSAKARQCLSDQARIDKEVELTSNVNSDFPEFKGTPGFAINGTFQPDVGTWAQLKPKIDEALR